MKKKFLRWAGMMLFLSICVQACKYDTDIPNPENYAKIYMPQAAEGTVDYAFTVSDTIEEIIFGAAYGGPGKHDSDVQVQFEVSPGLVDDFNEANRTSYEMLPSGNFEFTESTAIIPSGKLNSNPLRVKILTKQGMVPYKKYLLPISIKQLSGDVPLNDNLKTAYFVVEAQRKGVNIKIMSVAKGSGYADMEAVAEMVNAVKPDLLLIRELDVNTTRRPVNEPEVISELVGLPYSVFANALNYQGGNYGSAIFSRFPIVDSKTYMMPSSVSEKGPLAVAKLQIDDDHQLVFAGTHLQTTEARRKDMVPMLMDIMGEFTDIPVILAGNMNANPMTSNDVYDPLKTQFTLPCNGPCIPNFSKAAPASYSDMILFKDSDDFRVLNYSVGSTSVSNHLPVIVELQMYY